MILHWKIEVTPDDNQQTPPPTNIPGGVSVPVSPHQEGEIDWKRGAIHVAKKLPQGIIQSVQASVAVPVDPEEKIFMNGYQTWTYCPEYSLTDSIRGLDDLPKFLVRKYHLNRYGDYHFVEYPNQPGITHGFSYCYFRKGDHYRLFASLDEKPGYTMFWYNANTQVLSLSRDCRGVRWTHFNILFHAFDLFYAEGTEDEVFDAWFKMLRIKLRTKEPLTGYSSWYNRYEKINEASIRKDLAGCQGLLQPGDLFQIDDGWETAVGDWLKPNSHKFRNGMKPLVDEIHAAGFRAGLWLAPFVCQKSSRIYKEHREWLLMVDDAPFSCGSNWGGFYSLDIDVPEVQAYLRQVFDLVLNKWGFDLVKLDFLYGAAPFGTEEESRAGRMVRGMKFLREICGDKLILGCGVPVMPAFGYVDYCRVSCDVGLDWNGSAMMQKTHRERVSTKQAIENSIFRRQLNGRAYLSDPDVFFLRDKNIKLTKEQKDVLAGVNALMGSVLLTSDDPSEYTESQKNAYQELLHLRDATDVRVDADDGLRIRYLLDGEEHVISVSNAGNM